jgi:hypothetical protein
VTDAFFPDALQKLVGARPEKQPAVAAGSATGSAATAPRAVSGSSSPWPQWIAAEVVEDEVKSLLPKLGRAVETPLGFKGGEYQQARQYLSVLAALFAIDAEYGQPIRWQREAAAVRDLMARAGFNCKVGTDASYQEAKARHDDLQSLVRGGSIDAPAAEGTPSWDQIADRGPLMKRLEQAQDRGLALWTASAAEFDGHLEQVAHEAQLIAALAAVVQQDGYEYADDESYREHAETMRTQALAARDAVRAKDYAQARRAAAEITKACAACHEGFRN